MMHSSSPANSGGFFVRDLSFAYPEREPVFNQVSFCVAPGERVLLCGATGSGKSTLLRCLKPELTPVGKLTGEVVLDGAAVHANVASRSCDSAVSAALLGFVLQDATQQLVMDTPRAELAFGLENLGLPSALINRRIAEIAHYFGIVAWLDRPVTQLSGGQRQMLNLAAIVAMKPRFLLLDEPTAQLDPIAARSFYDLLWRINYELGIGLILIEHSLEEVYGWVDTVLYLCATQGETTQQATAQRATTQQEATQQGTVDGCAGGRAGIPSPVVLPQTCCPALSLLGYAGPRKDFAAYLRAKADPYQAALPYREQTQTKTHTPTTAVSPQTPGESGQKAPVALEAKRLYFCYERHGAYVLRELSCTVSAGQILGIVGGNASGKSTLLELLSGVLKPQHGKVMRASGLRAAALPQDASALFMHDTLAGEVNAFTARRAKSSRESALEQGSGGRQSASGGGVAHAPAKELLKRFGLIQYGEVNPFDLSGGEQQLLALVLVLLTNADILLLDEPTTALDYAAKAELALVLKEQCAAGKALVIVSHDLDFVAEVAHETTMLFDGALIERAPSAEFFANNLFYTTAAQRWQQSQESVQP